MHSHHARLIYVRCKSIQLTYNSKFDLQLLTIFVCPNNKSNFLVLFENISLNADEHVKAWVCSRKINHIFAHKNWEQTADFISKKTQKATFPLLTPKWLLV